MGSKALIIGAVVTGLVLVGLFAPKVPGPNETADVAQTWQPDPRGVAAAKLLLLDEFSGYLAGVKTVRDWGDVQKVDERVTATQLYGAYNENEVAADEKFKGKVIILTGRVGKISKDLFDNIYLVLHGGGYLNDVQGYLADAATKQAAQMQTGDEVALTCTGSGMVLTFPIAKDCRPTEMIVRGNEEVINQIVDQTLSSEGESDAKTKWLVAYGYVVGVALPKGNACETATWDNMPDCRTALDKLPPDKIVKLVDEFIKLHNFPAMPKREKKP